MGGVAIVGARSDTVSFVFSFVFFCFLSFSLCYCTFLAFFCGVSGVPFTDFVAASPRVLGRSEVGGWGVSGWSFPGSELFVA